MRLLSLVFLALLLTGCGSGGASPIGATPQSQTQIQQYSGPSGMSATLPIPQADASLVTVSVSTQVPGGSPPPAPHTLALGGVVIVAEATTTISFGNSPQVTVIVPNATGQYYLEGGYETGGAIAWDNTAYGPVTAVNGTMTFTLNQGAGLGANLVYVYALTSG